MKNKIHRFEITVDFEKSCHRSQAFSEIKAAIYKEVFSGNGYRYGDECIDVVKIKYIRNATPDVKGNEENGN